MPIYIIRPKTNIVAQSLSLIDRKFTPESRKKQTQEVIDVYREDPHYQEMVEWAQEEGQKEDIKIIKDPQQPNITGTMIVEMSQEEAEQAILDLSDHYILENRPLDLIRPKKVTATHKSEGELTEEDLWHLEAIALNSRPGITGKGVTIAVLDTGIDASHPALQAKVKGAYQLDFDKRQFIFLGTSSDSDGHGTHVAGLISGKKIGVAPNANLVSVEMIPNGRGDLSNFDIALTEVGQQPEVSIVNISAGKIGYHREMEDTIDGLLRVGILPVCAVGNEGENTSRSPGNYRSVVSVGASDRHHKVASFSGGGTLMVDNQIYTVPDLVAPGKGVYSSVIAGGYEAWNGTSMATPLVSGIAALILEQYPDIEVMDLKQELLSRCQDLGYPKERQGKGLIRFQ